MEGAVAQLVEQRTENPCVAGSIPAHTTKPLNNSGVFLFYVFRLHPVLRFSKENLRWFYQ